MTEPGRVFRVYDATSFGAAIREFRSQRGLSQEQLATLCGVSRPYLSDLERGKVTEQLERLVRILELLGVDITLVDRGGRDG